MDILSPHFRGSAPSGQRYSWLFACVTALLMTSCDDKNKPVPEPTPPPTTGQAETPKKPASPKLPEGLVLPEKNLKPFDENDHLTWPVELEVDKNGKAIPPKTTHNRKQKSGIESFVKAVLESPFGEHIPQRRFVQSGTDSTYFRQPFKTIVRPPKSGGQKGGSSKHQAGPNGERYQFDADLNIWKITYPDGRTEEHFGGDGSEGSLFTYPPGTHPQGITQIAFDENGNMTIQYDDGTMIGIEEKDEEPTGDQKSGNGPPPSNNKEGGAPEGSDPESGAGIPEGGPSPGGSGSGDPRKNLGEPDGGFIDRSGGPGSDPLSQGVGEPHYVTRDGTHFTTQAAGEFVLVGGVSGRGVQVRQEPWKGTSTSVSAITALAFKVGESKVEIRLDGSVLLDGVKAQEDPMVQGDIPGGGVVGAWRKDSKLVAAVVVWPDLSAVWITPRSSWMDFTLQWVGEAPEHRGLLGSNDGDASNDLTDRQGTVVKAVDDAGVASFVNSWRITDEESLFTYDEGKSTATYTLLDFPSEQPEFKYKELAEECCGHLPEGIIKEMCIYDVSLTGEREFAETYKKASGWHRPMPDGDSSSPMKVPAPKGDGTLSEEERQSATAFNLSDGRTINETLAEGESKVFSFEFNDPNSPRLGFLSEELDPTKKYTPGIAGYGLFNDKGEAIGAMTSATNDFPMVDLPLGTYYLKLVGPGLIHIKFH